ncbi:MAG: SMC family ATPase [Cyanobacteriota bacterium]
MKIVEIKLENFKSYENQSFNFEAGINAICGPNGSGKTSVIEAISWVLFDHLPYKNQDTIIRMTRSESNQLAPIAKVARVIVTFISDLDNNEYTICRNTRSQYYIVDKLTDERVAEGKREVIPFLKKHYNLSESANLEELFINTLGVPQGTFTSIFLDTATNRKKVFDKVLNIEDYRKVYEDLKEFKSFLKDLINDQKIKIATFETELTKIPLLENEIKDYYDDIDKNNKLLNSINSDINKYSELFNNLECLFKEIEMFNNEIEKEKINIKNIQNNIQSNNLLIEDSSKALELLKSLKKDYNDFLTSKEVLKKLEKDKEHIDKLEKDLTKQEKESQNILNLIKNNEDKLKEFEILKHKISELTPLQEKHSQLETDKALLDQHIINFKEHETTLKISLKELENIKDHMISVEKELSDILELKTLSDSFEKINKTYTDLQMTLKEVNLKITENKHMASQVKGGLCPFLKETCKNISEGYDLETFFKEKILELEQLNFNYKKEFTNIEKDYKLAFEASEKIKALKAKQEEKEKLDNKLKKLQQDIVNTEKLMDDYKNVPDKLAFIIKELEKLGSPRDKISVYNQQLSEEKKVLSSLNLAQKNKSNIDTSINNIKNEILNLNFDNDYFQKLKQQLVSLETSYHSYIKAEETARNHDKYINNSDKLESDLNKNISILADIENKLSVLKTNYDSTEHIKVKALLEKNKLDMATIKETIKNKHENLNKCELELKALVKIRTNLANELTTLEELNHLNSFIDLSRDIFKACGPLIARFYIQNIAIEANNLYQEIIQKQTQSLDWGLDYEITIEENGLIRPFNNLSGGEQMAAALAIRLSLLKELSDINIAFFDEPTTNMDEIRRSNLAEQIKNITAFDQLFIISHDDTFERDIDNVIRLN